MRSRTASRPGGPRLDTSGREPSAPPETGRCRVASRGPCRSIVATLVPADARQLEYERLRIRVPNEVQTLAYRAKVRAQGAAVRTLSPVRPVQLHAVPGPYAIHDGGSQRGASADGLGDPRWGTSPDLHDDRRV